MNELTHVPESNRNVIHRDAQPRLLLRKVRETLSTRKTRLVIAGGVLGACAASSIWSITASQDKHDFAADLKTCMSPNQAIPNTRVSNPLSNCLPIYEFIGVEVDYSNPEGYNDGYVYGLSGSEKSTLRATADSYSADTGFVDNLGVGEALAGFAFGLIITAGIVDKVQERQQPTR